MRFWDSSALLPLLVREPTSKRLEDLLRLDTEIALWWGTPVECVSALTRVHRSEDIRSSDLRKAQALLSHLHARAYEIQPVEEVRARAQRLLAVHRLRAAAALQLAAALVWCRERPQGFGFVCLDDRLRGAAALEGFLVMPYSEEVHEEEFED